MPKQARSHPSLMSLCGGNAAVAAEPQTCKIQSSGSEHLHPGGMVDNNPTFQRWVREFKELKVPKGRLKLTDSSAVPSGLDPSLSLFPKFENLGYYRISLRENDFRWTCP